MISVIRATLGRWEITSREAPVTAARIGPSADTEDRMDREERHVTKRNSRKRWCTRALPEGAV